VLLHVAAGCIYGIHKLSVIGGGVEALLCYVDHSI